MPEKTRVSSAPRTVKAPRRRDERKAPNRRTPILVGVAVLVVVGTAIAALATRLGGEASAANAMREAGCTSRTYPATTSKPVPESAKVEYNSFPRRTAR